MTTTVLKFPLTAQHRQTVMLPQGGQIVACQPQHGNVTLWVACEVEMPPEPHQFVCVTTGQPVPDDAGDYLATCQFHDGHTVVHVFHKEPTA